MIKTFEEYINFKQLNEMMSQDFSGEEIEIVGLGKTFFKNAKFSNKTTILVTNFDVDNINIPVELNGKKKYYNREMIKYADYSSSDVRLRYKPVIYIDVKFRGKEYKHEQVSFKRDSDGECTLVFSTYFLSKLFKDFPAKYTDLDSLIDDITLGYEERDASFIKIGEDELNYDKLKNDYKDFNLVGFVGHRTGTRYESFDDFVYIICGDEKNGYTYIKKTWDKYSI